MKNKSFLNRTLYGGKTICISAELHEDAATYPLLSDLFSIEKLKKHGETMARIHSINDSNTKDLLLPGLAYNEKILKEIFVLLTDEEASKQTLPSAGVWFLDNFYLIGEQILTAREHLPERYSRALPKLASGPFVGFPRVYDIVQELIVHVDGRIDDGSLRSIVTGYQSVTALKLGELWAIPIMLRLALIGNLRRVASRILGSWTESALARSWAERMYADAAEDPKKIILDMAEMERADIPLSGAFVSEFAKRLRSQNAELNLPLVWLEQRLSRKGSTIEKKIRTESRHQATNQISISNSISSLRFLMTVDWKNFVESNSAVDIRLMNDPSGQYGGMDFATRDRYRHSVEKLAQQSAMAEEYVAEAAISCAMAAADDRTRHVGYFLTGRGMAILEKKIKIHQSFRDLCAHILQKAPVPLYLSAIAVTTSALSGVLLYLLPRHHPAMIVAELVFLCICFSRLAVMLVNRSVTMVIDPESLCKMDFIRGIPSDMKTLVTVPSMLSREDDIDCLLTKMEVCYLSNNGENIFFSLLTDFTDAPEKNMPDDAALLSYAQSGIRNLNDRYGTADKKPFLLFHRFRQFNSRDRIWMGHERKRGKLEALNRFLLTDAPGDFLIEGDISAMKGIRYVITLDTDTQLPLDAARHLVETMSHPLNRPVYDAKRRIVTDGYTIIQPRVVSGHPSAETSWYARLFGSDSGIDPYTRAVSDVYQDLSHEGSFIGKGIYDVAMFAAVTAGRFPDNRILSHDLLEGNYCRSALASDIQFVDEFPGHYRDDASRRHRWIRGDWQIATWILPFVPDSAGRYVRNNLSLLSKWKIFDNLRRSIVPSSLMLLIVLPFFFMKPQWIGLVTAAGIWFFPVCLESAISLLRKPEKYPLRLHLCASAVTILHQTVGSMVEFLFLPHDAYTNTDAVIRTVWRLHLSHKKCLEWKSHHESVIVSGKGLLSNIRFMWMIPSSMIILSGMMVFFGNGCIGAYGVLALWAAAPVIAWYSGRTRIRRKESLPTGSRDFLRKISRKTWRYFETFAGADNNWLPSDNYQEAPVEAIARRTSPTNIGLMLLSNLGASDLGYIPAGELIDATFRSFVTLSGLERFRGHFFNWYDTVTLKPLPPAYISTVDSGNMSGYLLTLRRGLINLGEQAVFPASCFRGLEDTILVLSDLLIPRPDVLSVIFIQKTPVEERINALTKCAVLAAHETSSLSAVLKNLDDLIFQAEQLRPFAGADSSAQWWCEALEKQCRAHRQDLLFIAPWLGSPEFAVMPVHLHSVLDANMKLVTLADLDPASFADICTTDIRIAGSPADKASLPYLIRQGIARGAARISRIEKLAMQCQSFADIDFSFLYDTSRRLLAIGYDTTSHRRDDGLYDLLASEARLGSFIGIAQGKLPVEHWFSLGRLVTVQHGRTMLISWGGSMFEYLMPQLVMPSYDTTLLDTTCRAVVDRQISYGLYRGDFWGISESAENMTDAGLNYQYRSFGVPDLGFKRGLANDLVISPYSSVLALQYSPRKACENLRKMSDQGFEGRYGFYEAIDYTPSRHAMGGSEALVKSFMSHHQGMSFLSLVNFFTGNIMVKRFSSDPLFHTASLLLQEKVPRTVPFKLPPSDIYTARESAGTQEDSFRAFPTPHTLFPEVHLLSNGRYHVMVTNAGGGFSRWKGLAVTRWNEDPTRDNAGSFLYINDLSSDAVWSGAYQPTLKEPKKYEAIFLQARAEFRRSDQGLDTFTEIAVSPEEDVEYRRITVSNVSLRTRTVELTSYQEIDLLPPGVSQQHPAFSNLFVQTSIIKHQRAILATRRPRSPGEKNPWMFHLLSLDKDDIIPDVSYETDRMKFIGRGRSTVNPSALEKGNRGLLEDTEGSVLDAVAAIRCTLTLKPGESATVGFVTGMAETENEARVIIEKYQDRRLADRVFELAVVHDRVKLQQRGITPSDAQLYDSLAGSILYANGSRRAAPNVLMKNNRGQSALWAYSISGDLPIVLLRLADESKISLAAELIQAHAYWRRKGIQSDLVIWNENFSGYRQSLNDAVMGLIAAEPSSSSFDKPGGIFIKHPDQMTEEDRILMLTAARVILTDGGGSLSEQIRQTVHPEPVHHQHRAVNPQDGIPADVAFAQSDLLFNNGFGGFTEDGREYIIHLTQGVQTPMPWVNVIANKRLGTVVSQGGSYTWYENAHEFRLTPWYNDAVSDSGGEALYIKDRISGEFWSPTPLPSPGSGDYLNRHGFGYSVFEYLHLGIKSELWVYVDTEDPVKFWLLKLRNDGSSRRSLSASAFLECVLGDSRAKTRMYVRTGIDVSTGALIATNPYTADFPGRVMFLESSESDRSISGDRTEFIGRNGTLYDPAAMYAPGLSGKVGDGLDPAAAMQVYFDLEPGQEKEIVFIFGAGRDADEARMLALRHRSSLAAYQARDRVWEFWKHTLGAVTIQTPDRALDLITNGWLVYQVLSSRLMARSGFYQSGGAFGFRDQLQDVMALVYSRPELVREQILLCASKQFPEGDVQHWWHPPLGRGVRTRISDDYLWLPFVTAFYVKHTGDTGILDEHMHFLEGRALSGGEESCYDMPGQTEIRASLYDHCTRAITHALRFGAHGLPLMGSGDWNDGMNLVGIEGKGESVWLGFFLHHVITEFRDIAVQYGDASFAEECLVHTSALEDSIDASAWDGEWFLRGYFDDGSTLGSSRNRECRIDSISQSWAVLSGASSVKKTATAMLSLDAHLVRPDEGIICLLDPPFDVSLPEPGYIKGYPPGIRENGGQYTHAAVWAAMAFARQGCNEKMGSILSMLNPVNHGSTAEKINRYKVEPYVMAADIYSAQPYVGRGGWTWYTGSASWMYRLVIESVFGMQLSGETVIFTPCLPSEWKECSMQYRFRETMYHIVLHQTAPGTVTGVFLDDGDVPGRAVRLVDDRKEHTILVRIGAAFGIV